VFYFGKSANLIQNAQELSIYRGTFRNLTTLSGVNYPAIPFVSNNPIKSNQDTTKLQNKSIGASYDIFSTQVEANRGYNLMNTQQEYERYQENKSYAKWNLVCTKRRPFSRRKMVCTQVESRPILYKDMGNGQCSPYDKTNGIPINKDEDNKDVSCENLSEFTERRWGGASPVNLDLTGLSQGIYQLTYFNGMNALSEIFDIAGSKALTGAQRNANTYKAYKGAEQGGYASPTALQIARKANSTIGQTDTTD
jgi:hypothetical protein